MGLFEGMKRMADLDTGILPIEQPSESDVIRLREARTYVYESLMMTTVLSPEACERIADQALSHFSAAVFCDPRQALAKAVN